VDQILHSSEKRLVRILLLLARSGRQSDSKSRGAEGEPADSRGDGRYDALASELLHERR
jgi:hypothetical protein